MKEKFRKIFSPILNIFENYEGPYKYKPLHRKILIVIGILFSGLAIGVFFIAPEEAGLGVLFPVIVFLAVGIVSLIVGLLGSDRAVARIWGNR
ncbi:MAG TPA: hypothetical protein VLN56_05375 [Gammaproteobacteria bacterium]|nr:hypothetical protein [Gammaproteobacteria bacterium]